MHRTAVMALVLAAAAASGRADIIEQSFSYKWTGDDAPPEFAFEAFNTVGGTRQLTGIRLGFEGTIQMEITAQTYGDALAAGEWSVEASHSVVAFFTDGPGLFQGMGGQWLAGVTGDLGAGSDGEPGTPYVVLDTLQFTNVVDVDSSYYSGFEGEGIFHGIMGGFYDGVLTPPDNGQFVEFFPSFLSQDGTVTLTYEYVVVPAPAGIASLACVGLGLARRRR